MKNVSKLMDNELVAMIVEDMASQGYQVMMGGHFLKRGYFAQFFRVTHASECFECGQEIRLDSWQNTGHGFTLLQAVAEGREIAMGLKSGPALDSEAFR